MATDKKSLSIYAEHLAPEGKKAYYRSKTIDLQAVMEKTGRYVSITTFLNDRDGELSASNIFNESDAKYLPKPKEESATPGPAPVGGRSDLRRV